MSPCIALLTDFGLKDSYAGVLKGVIAGIAPQAKVVDLSHGVSAQDVHEAAFTLLTSYRYYPPHTLFCCVVDPGVGSERLAVGVRVDTKAGPYTFICPDNGLLTPILHQSPATVAVVLDDPRYHLSNPSPTFHGRDIFAPAAAHLAGGVPLRELGSRFEPAALQRLAWPEPRKTAGGWHTSIIHIDHFGNLITNLPGKVLEGETAWRVHGDGLTMSGIKQTFADVEQGEPVAYIGSSGFLELAVRQGNAQRSLKLERGSELRLEHA